MSAAAGGLSPAEKSRRIASLVQQLKSGQINRTELFEKLTKLQRGIVDDTSPARASVERRSSSPHQQCVASNKPPTIAYLHIQI